MTVLFRHMQSSLSIRTAIFLDSTLNLVMFYVSQCNYKCFGILYKNINNKTGNVRTT
jgi:hypothetical protein